MKTIWKYTLPIAALNPLELPKGAEVLSVQAQWNYVTLWALVDPEAKVEKRRFEVFGTGHAISYDEGMQREYVGTAQVQGGELVWHVFERTE